MYALGNLRVHCITNMTHCIYASPSPGDAYSDRQRTPNFEFWVKIFVCRHVSIWGFQNRVCLSIRLSKRNHHSLVNISPALVNDTSMEGSSLVLYHEKSIKKTLNWVFLLLCFIRHFLAYTVHIDWCYYSIHKDSTRSEHIPVLPTCTCLATSGDASSSFRGWHLVYHGFNIRRAITRCVSRRHLLDVSCNVSVLIHIKDVDHIAWCDGQLSVSQPLSRGRDAVCQP